MSRTVYTQFAKPINIDKAQVQLLKHCDDYRNKQYLFNEVKPILVKYAGKKVTKRLITALKKALPQFNCYLKWVGVSQCYLEVQWYDEKKVYERKCELSIFLGHIGSHSWAEKENGKGYYTMNMIEQNNKWIYEIDLLLQSSMNGMKQLRDRAERWNSLLERMQSIGEEMDKYHLLGTYFKFTEEEIT